MDVSAAFIQKQLKTQFTKNQNVLIRSTINIKEIGAFTKRKRGIKIQKGIILKILNIIGISNLPIIQTKSPFLVILPRKSAEVETMNY